MNTGKRVLLVDDDAGVLRLMQQVLAREGHASLSASTAERALQIAEAEGDRFDLAVVDYVLNGKSGIELARTLSERNERLRVLLVSAFPVQREASAAGLQAVTFLAKPFSVEEFSERIRASLGTARADPEPR